MAVFKMTIVLTVVLLFSVDNSRADISDVACDTADAGCHAINGAECVAAYGGAQTCQCKEGYTEDSDTCVQDTVSTTDCSNDKAVCEDITHSTCVDGKCKCDEGYKETVMECVKEI